MASVRHRGRRRSTDDSKQNHRGKEKDQWVPRGAHLQNIPSAGETSDLPQELCTCAALVNYPLQAMNWAPSENPPTR
jgi:hypothetical protein